ncbi:MAG: biopolymer transporter Tol, partial [Pirellulales bacterium]
MSAAVYAEETPQLTALESKYLANLVQVTHDFAKAGEGYFSPDGSTIVFQAEPTTYPFYQIYTLDLANLAAGAEPKLISTGRGRTTCSYFSPDGERVIFASSHLDPRLGATEQAERDQRAEDAREGRRRRYNWDFDLHYEIFQAKPDGSELTRLTDTEGYDAEGAYSPDGESIVFCSDRDGDPDLYIMNADGSEVRQLTNSDGYDGGPFFSPDGEWVIYRTDRKKEGHLQIHAIRVDGEHDVTLTDNIGVNWAPYWHPTEPWIIWCGADHSDPKARPNYDLHVMQYEFVDGVIRGGKQVTITSSPAADVLPVFSPDGRRLMWTSTRTPQHASQLFLADL